MATVRTPIDPVPVRPSIVTTPAPLKNPRSKWIQWGVLASLALIAASGAALWPAHLQNAIAYVWAVFGFGPRTLCVFRHGPSLLALSPNKFLLPASSHTLFLFATFFRNSRLPSTSCHLLCSAAQLRPTSTPALRSIQFA
jgi:hypothetical protein